MCKFSETRATHKTPAANLVWQRKICLLQKICTQFGSLQNCWHTKYTLVQDCSCPLLLPKLSGHAIIETLGGVRSATAQGDHSPAEDWHPEDSGQHLLQEQGMSACARAQMCSTV